ncbi:MAG: hypothetical protein RL090_251 [Bacteroidota bacterium]
MKLKDPVNSVFNTGQVINCTGDLLDLTTPKVMGILNVTPDSFYDGGKFTDLKAIMKQVKRMVKEGVDIIDVGGQSTRPGAKMIATGTELKRVIPVIEKIKEHFPDMIVSVDTYRSEVAQHAIKVGAGMVNDISAGAFDRKMHSTVAKSNAAYVLMHMKGMPETMQQNPRYKDVVQDVLKFLAEKTEKCRKMGIRDVIVDPGFGFGKTLAHNFQLLSKMEVFKITGCPLLAGISRKSMIYKTLDINQKEALNGTTALNMTALMKGASILRVHDVKPAKETIRLFDMLNNAVNK